VVGLAVAAALGSWRALGVPWWLAVALACLSWRKRWPAGLCVAVFLLAGALAHRTWAGTTPLAPGPVRAEVTLLDDPAPARGAVRATARLGRAHVELWARAGAAGQLRLRLAGERVVVAGSMQRLSPSVAIRLAQRHIRGRLEVASVSGWRAGDPASRAANRIRRAMADGADALPPVERSLFLGFVLGDDREQSEAVREMFRASGLAHLTAVSGQNVALTLLIVRPLLMRLGLRARWVATLGVIAWFALLTRFEPSVLRAAVMAGLAATSAFLARPASTVRLLALAVTALLLVDPLLVWSVGFWLSVGATAGIAVLSGPIAHAVPGPRSLAAAIGVTAGAQLGVAPVQLAVFGPLPLASIPANLLAVPVAGPVMVWGLPAGVIAGLLPSAAPMLHLPTLLGVRWIAFVARLGQAAPLGSVGAVELAAVATTVVPVVLLVRRRRRTAPGGLPPPGA
jgi:competence protein ComEC